MMNKARPPLADANRFTVRLITEGNCQPSIDTRKPAPMAMIMGLRASRCPVCHIALPSDGRSPSWAPASANVNNSGSLIRFSTTRLSARITPAKGPNTSSITG